VNDASSDDDGGGTVRDANRPPPPLCGARRASGGRRAVAQLARRSALAWALALAGFIPFFAAGCSPGGREPAMTPPARPLSEVLAAHTPEWMVIPGVVGTAESRLPDGRPSILVLVVRLTPEIEKRIPKSVEGWPVRIEESGEIHAMPDSGR
jgi:hypothetical protein